MYILQNRNTTFRDQVKYNIGIHVFVTTSNTHAPVHKQNGHIHIPSFPRGAKSSDISLNGSMVVDTLLQK